MVGLLLAHARTSSRLSDGDRRVADAPPARRRKNRQILSACHPCQALPDLRVSRGNAVRSAAAEDDAHVSVC